MSYRIVKGDLLLHNGVITHQTNCTSNNAKGLASLIFKKYPLANTYNRNNIRTPGTVEIINNIVNLYGQKSPGKPNNYETRATREKWFKSCLDQLGEISKTDEKYKTIAFPYMIGCGLANGVWVNYERMLKEFATTYCVNVIVYKLE